MATKARYKGPRPVRRPGITPDRLLLILGRTFKVRRIEGFGRNNETWIKVWITDQSGAESRHEKTAEQWESVAFRFAGQIRSMY